MSAEGLSMSLDDIIAKRQAEKKTERPQKPKAEGSGKAKPAREERRQQAPPRSSKPKNDHDDRRGGAENKRLESKKVYITNIGEMDWKTLKSIFTEGGLAVRHADVKSGANGKNAGIVEFARFEDASKAISEYDRALVDGREIHVKEYKEQQSGARDAGRADRADKWERAGASSSGAHDGSIVVKKPSAKVQVHNLPFDLKEEELTGIFRECGRILDSQINRGRGLIEFQSVDGAKKAIKEFDGAEVNGRVIEVSYAK